MFSNPSFTDKYSTKKTIRNMKYLPSFVLAKIELKFMVGQLAYSLRLPLEFLFGKVQKNALANNDAICFCERVILSLVHRQSRKSMCNVCDFLKMLSIQGNVGSILEFNRFLHPNIMHLQNIFLISCRTSQVRVIKNWAFSVFKSNFQTKNHYNRPKINFLYIKRSHGIST